MTTTIDRTVEDHEVHYAGKVDPRPGTVLGVGMDGRQATVLGTVFADGVSTVMVEVEAPDEPEVPQVIEAIAMSIAAAYNEHTKDAGRTAPVVETEYLVGDEVLTETEFNARVRDAAGEPVTYQMRQVYHHVELADD